MRERKNSLAMGLGVHGGRRVRDLVEWGLRTERESRRWLAGSGLEREKAKTYPILRRPQPQRWPPPHLFFSFFLTDEDHGVSHFEYFDEDHGAIGAEAQLGWVGSGDIGKGVGPWWLTMWWRGGWKRAWVCRSRPGFAICSLVEWWLLLGFGGCSLVEWWLSSEGRNEKEKRNEEREKKMDGSDPCPTLVKGGTSRGKRGAARGAAARGSAQGVHINLVSEQDMGDERVETLANEVANLTFSASSQQQTFKELQEMVAALHMADNRNTDHGQNSHSGSHGRTSHAGTAKIEAVDKELLTRDEILKELRQNIQQAQVRMKQNADKHRRDVEFAVGDWVYLRLQPYRQSSIAFRKNLKLSPRYFGPFQVVERVGAVAYKLKLPAESKLHSVFHVSNLKRKLGSQEEASTMLPVIDNSDGLVPLPQAILDRRTRRSKEEVLVHWQGLSPADATWEDAQSLRLRFSGIIP
uniref:Chromo domain-containing protein n=1 Tax=Fagus sylvatica TaxID=28930 RepID=A0A2N9H2J1_FAGSY